MSAMAMAPCSCCNNYPKDPAKSFFMILNSKPIDRQPSNYKDIKSVLYIKIAISN